MAGSVGPPKQPPLLASSKSTPESGFEVKKVEDYMLAGAFAGVVGRLISAPLDLLKIRFQLQSGIGSEAKYRNVWQATKTIIKEEGFTSLWKGNLSATFLWVSYSMVQFGVYGVLEEWSNAMERRFRAKISSISVKNKGDPLFGSDLGSGITEGTNAIHWPHNRFLHTFMLFLCGAGAAILATSCTYPFDIMRTQFSLQGNSKIYKGIPSFISTTLQKQGVKGFYAGLGPTLVGVTPYIGLNFALYDLAKSVVGVDQKNANPILQAVKKSIAGGFAGTTSKLMVYPLDTIKRRMQASVLQSTLVVPAGAAAAPPYESMLDCFSKTVRKEGWQGLYKGVGPTMLKSAVSTSVTFVAYEQALKLLRVSRNSEK